MAGMEKFIMNATFATRTLVFALLLVFLSVTTPSSAGAATRAERRAEAWLQLGKANQKAYETFKALLSDPADELDQIGRDYWGASQALMNLSQRDKIDDLRLLTAKA